MIGAWLKARRAAQAARHHEQGWNWAAGSLLAGQSIEVTRGWAEYGVHFDGPNTWDKGIQAACDEWERKMP